MTMQHVQAAPAAVMIRPARFAINPETAGDNVFQAGAPVAPPEALSERAKAEFDAVADALIGAGVRVHVFDEIAERDTPDAVFPNNWFSTHHGGRIAVFPMLAPNRRRERRQDVIEFLKERYRVQEVVDYSGLEYDGLFLEGTGAMVLDHLDRVAYVARSERADPIILERFCTSFGYEPLVFDAADADGRVIYHTNVLMCVATEYALVCLEALADSRRRDEVASRLREAGRVVIDLSRDQLHEFAGNALELTGTQGRVLALSARAAAALREDQLEVIERSARLLSVPIPTIELSGGSVRCMIAAVHLAQR